MGSALPPIWVISLRRAPERRRFVEEVFGELGLSFEILDAVDSRQLSAAQLGAYSERRATYLYGRGLGRGMLACSLSHLGAMQRLVSSNLPEVVIFEDDTRPVEDFGDLLAVRDQLPADRDVVTFHSLFGWASPSPVGQPLIGSYRACRYARTPMGTQAYLITRTAAERVLEAGYPVALPPDELLLRPHPCGLTVYGVEPSPVTHVEFPSEIHARPEPATRPSFGERLLLVPIRFVGRAKRRIDRVRDR